MTEREQFLDWLGELLWYWQAEDIPVSADMMAEVIIAILETHQSHALQPSVHRLPIASELLLEMGTRAGRNEIVSRYAYLGELSGEQK